MNITTARQFIFDWLKASTNLTVIEEKQSEARPNLPYVAFDFVNPSSRVGAVDETDSTLQQVSMRGIRRTMVSIHVLGAGALDTLSNVRDSLDQPDVMERFELAGFAHESESEVRDLSERLEQRYEERAQMDLILTYAFNKDVTTSTIEHFTGTGTIGGQSTDVEASPVEEI